MAMSYEELAAKYSVDREVVDAHKERLLTEIRAHEQEQEQEQEQRIVV